MYSYEDRMKAVELYIKYDLSLADTIRELGYPSRNMLARWHKEYLATGGLHGRYKKTPKFSSEQMQAAVAYYLDHGHNITRTIRAMGYPSRPVLRDWIDVLAPGKRKSAIKDGTYKHPFPQGEKQIAVIELCSQAGSAASIAEQSGTSRTSLYKWKRKLLGEEECEAYGQIAQTAALRGERCTAGRA